MPYKNGKADRVTPRPAERVDFGGAEEGNAMVLAVLVLVTLTSVGIVSVQRTNSELMVAGNVARSAQANSSSEVGVNHSMVLLAEKEQQLVGTMIENAVQGQAGISDDKQECLLGPGTQERHFTLLCRSSSVNDPDGANKQFAFPIVDKDVVSSRNFQAVAQSVTVVPIGEIKGRPGDDVDGNFCYETFDFNARGGVPSTEAPVEDTLCLYEDQPCKTDTVIMQNRVRVLVGPGPCRAKQQ